MLNFLFGVLCAAGTVFGSILTYDGVTGHNHEAVIAGGIFLFGSLLTFGIGQIHRLMRAQYKKMVRARGSRRANPAFRMEPGPDRAPFGQEPFPFPERAEPVIAHPAIERVASRFARPGR
ncbi:MAG: hypothetical protein ACLFWF_01120 [Alphaproteobacteria bacterium]